MATYEMDGEDVAYLVELLKDRDTPQIIDLALRLEQQLPIPVPTKIGAVVTTTGAAVTNYQVFVRWATDNHTHSPWIEVGNHEQPYRTDEIGRITEVLSPGVDL